MEAAQEHAKGAKEFIGSIKDSGYEKETTELAQKVGQWISRETGVKGVSDQRLLNMAANGAVDFIKNTIAGKDWARQYQYENPNTWNKPIYNDKGELIGTNMTAAAAQFIYTSNQAKVGEVVTDKTKKSDVAEWRRNEYLTSQTIEALPKLDYEGQDISSALREASTQKTGRGQSWIGNLIDVYVNGMAAVNDFLVGGGAGSYTEKEKEEMKASIKYGLLGVGAALGRPVTADDIAAVIRAGGKSYGFDELPEQYKDRLLEIAKASSDKSLHVDLYQVLRSNNLNVTKTSAKSMQRLGNILKSMEDDYSIGVKGIALSPSQMKAETYQMFGDGTVHGALVSGNYKNRSFIAAATGTYYQNGDQFNKEVLSKANPNGTIIITNEVLPENTLKYQAKGNKAFGDGARMIVVDGKAYYMSGPQGYTDPDRERENIYDTPSMTQLPLLKLRIEETRLIYIQ